MWNIKLIKNIVRVFMLLLLVLLFCNSCDDVYNPMTNEEPCCVTPPYHEVMST